MSANRPAARADDKANELLQKLSEQKPDKELIHKLIHNLVHCSVAIRKSISACLHKLLDEGLLTAEMLFSRINKPHPSPVSRLLVYDLPLVEKLYRMKLLRVEQLIDGSSDVTAVFILAKRGAWDLILNLQNDRLLPIQTYLKPVDAELYDSDYKNALEFIHEAAPAEVRQQIDAYVQNEMLISLFELQEKEILRQALDGLSGPLTEMEPVLTRLLKLELGIYDFNERLQWVLKYVAQSSSKPAEKQNFIRDFIFAEIRNTPSTEKLNHIIQWFLPENMKALKPFFITKSFLSTDTTAWNNFVPAMKALFASKKADLTEQVVPPQFKALLLGRDFL